MSILSGLPISANILTLMGISFFMAILYIEPSTLGMKAAKPLQPGESKVLTAVITKGNSL